MSELTDPAAEETVQEEEVPEQNQTEEAVHAEKELAAEAACQKKEKEEEVEVDVTEHEPEVLREESVQDPDHSELGNEQQLEQQAEENQDKPLEVSQDTMQLPVVSMSQGAIEDEEMPSMISISSPSRIDDSEVNIKLGDNKSSVDMKEYNSKTSPKKEEDDDSDSVCVIDDDDEEEDRSSLDEEDENSSYQEEESDEMDTDDNYSRRRGRIERSREEIDEDDDEEDEEDDDEEEEGDDDDDSEPHYSDGGSDDIAVRHSNGLSKHHKERSASLQDLSRIKEQVVRSKQNVNPFSQKARFERNKINAEQRPQGRPYAHVESKVKKYIDNMTEQRRMSIERRRKSQEEARQKNQEIIESQPRRNDDVATTCKTIKEYSEKTLKEIAEYEENDEMNALQQPVENGDLSINPRRSLGNGEPVQRQEEMDVDPIAVEEYSNDETSDKINGTVLNENHNDFVPERKGILRREDCSPKPVLNGEEPSIVRDLRTLSYDEYMKGSVSKDDNEVVIDSESITKDAQDVQKFNNNETDTTCIFRIENVTSNYYSEEKGMTGITDSVMMVNQSTETYYEENSELLSQVTTLQSQLEERNIQFSGLSEAYRKVMSENLAMKMELDNLRKKMMQHEEKQKQEKKVIAVQTEGLVSNLNMPIIEVDEEQQQIDPKLAPSMISTASSQWTDGTNSVSYSMDPPPNLTTALNSDDSTNIQGKTPAKHKNAFSRAFMTSSRILQTLSSITHGKGKSDKHGNKRSKASVAKRTTEPTVENEKAQTTEPVQTNSRKRKATDTMEISSSAQPFKIPHMSTSDWEKQAASTPEPPIINIEDADEKNANENSEENSDDEEEIQELDDDVKVFIYPEDETGKEHSFLIQAKEITNNPKPGVRECGPYLLGNVEVFMTEMNGTINIWGKELNQGSTNQNVEELNTSTRSKDLKDGFRWQSTPRIFKNQGSSSSNKKSRVSPRSTQHHQQRHTCNASNTIVECENCSAHSHRLSWPSCNRSMHENQHTCCHPTFRVEDNHCGCVHKERRPCATACCNAQKFVDAKRFSMPSLYQDSCCNNHNQYTAPAHEESCRRHVSVRRNSFNDEEDDDSNDEENVQCTTKAQHHSLNENSPHSCNNAKMPIPPGSGPSRRASSGNCSDHSTGQNESDPLIFQKPNSEAPEVRKRRLSGRKVRGLLLDLLKGCGDCRTPANKTTNMSMYGPSTSAQMRDDYSQNQMSCPSRANEKCSSCCNRNDKTAEIEAQLEFFRSEMEKLRSRSDTLREMLDTLRTEDIIN